MKSSTLIFRLSFTVNKLTNLIIHNFILIRGFILGHCTKDNGENNENLEERIAIFFIEDHF